MLRLKRFFGLLLTLSMIISLVPVAYAEGMTVRIDGIGLSGEVLTAVVSGAPADETITYQWYYGPGKNLADARIHPITGAVSDNWTVNLQQCIDVSNTEGKFSDYPVWVKATCGTESATAKTFIAPGRNDGAVYNAVTKTGTDNVFAVDGKEFIVLDSTENEMFILAKDGYGTHKFDNSASMRYSTSRETNIGYWLNNDFLASGNGDGAALPEGIKQYINNHEWITNNLVSTADNGIETTTDTAKLALMSIEEFNKYSGRYGVIDDLSYRWWLRSSSNGTQALCADISKAKEGTVGFTTRYNLVQPLAVRPVFYLNKEIFANVKINAYTVGKEIKDIIKTSYPDYKSLANAGYSDEELALLGYELSAPEYSVLGTAENGNGIESIVISKDGETVAVGSVSDNTITFDKKIIAGAYTISINTTSDYEIGSVAIGGEELTVTDNTVSCVVMGDVTDLTVKLVRYYGELQSIRVVGEPVLGAEWTIEYEPSNIPVEDLEIKWLYGPGAYTDSRQKEIPNTNANKWTASYEDLKTAQGKLADYYIYAVVTYRGKTLTDVCAFAPMRNDYAVDGAVLNAPEENVFKVSGSNKEFILLDTVNGEHFVIAKDGYGTHSFNATNTTEYSTEKEGCIAAWLNDSESGFLAQEDTLPEKIKNAVDYEHTWKTEAIVDNDIAYLETTQGISLLSLNEYNIYRRKIGTNDTGSRWWLRSQANATQTLSITADGCGITTRYSPTSALTVRPAFWLKSNFLTTVKLDIDSLGENVRAVLAENADALTNLYTTDEIAKIKGEGTVSFKSAVFKNTQGTAIENVEEGTITVSAEIENTKDTEQNGTIILALYNNGVLEKTEVKKVVFEANSSDSYTAEITVDTVEGGYELAVFVWDDAETMKPLGTAKRIYAPQNLPFV